MGPDDWLIEAARKGMRPSPYDLPQSDTAGDPDATPLPANAAKQPTHSAAEWVRIYAQMESSATP